MTTLVTLTLPDGRTIRAASEACEVTSRANPTRGPYQYAGILIGEVDLVDELDPLSLDGVAALSQATIEITTDLDLQAMQGDWYQIVGARGEVATIDLDAGEQWEDRRVILADGMLQALELGRVGDVTRFVLETAPTESGELVGDPERDLNGDYGANNDITGAAFSDLTGFRAPTVIGRCYGVPAFKVDSGGGVNQACLAAHAFADLGSITAYEEGVSVGTFTPANTTAPSSGEPVCEISSAGQFAAADGAYTYDASRGGIAAADDASSPALMASGVLRKLLQLSGVRVDWAGSADALQRVAAYDVGVWLDEPADALEVMRSRLLPVLPIYEVQSSEGLRLVSADLRRQPEFVAVVGQQLVGSIGGIEFTDFDAIFNDFTLRYAYDSFAGDYQATSRLGATESALCTFSQQLFARPGVPGVRALTLEADCVWDATTAWKILRDLAVRYTLPRRRVAYIAAPDFARRIRAGAVGLLTDAERGISSVQCVVTSLQLGETPEVQMTLLDRSPVEET